jgi:hypothetical protein
MHRDNAAPGARLPSVRLWLRLRRHPGQIEQRDRLRGSLIGSRWPSRGGKRRRLTVLKAALALVTLGPVTTITSPALNGAGIDPARNQSLTRIG